ncbi:30S ribosomal protein S20 [Patescibacteria group bacterium]|nr:30S ribosomal protein S20 [Patescibacteria group bacterium]MBU1029380.1 30S ribosomal protein S20 [Patescibacteria group bacterium]MBU1916328.1 30S ribosomal protein S20 [Patescibacteria group bacterium]
MPIKKSAIKALRQTQKKTERNRLVKDHITYLRRLARKTIASGDLKKAEALAKDIIRAVDKAAQNGVLKKNTVARIKSRLVNKLK